MPLVATLSVSTCLFKTVNYTFVLRSRACRRAAAWKPEEGSVGSVVPGSSAACWFGSLHRHCGRVGLV